MFCTTVTKERVVIKLACQEEADVGEQRGGMMMLRSNEHHDFEVFMGKPEEDLG